MIKKTNFFLVLLFSIVIVINTFAGERTVPVDVFLMIDKSLSMDNPGKFDSLHKWVRQELIGQMLIPGDWITIYQFYEKPEEVLTLDIKNEQSRTSVINAIDSIKPDGKFTDIGAALDKIQASLASRGTNGRFKVLLLVTDLEHDAPWESKYRGKQESFQSPYLAEARIIKRDNWYEVTLDMDIQDTVVNRTQSLYSDVLSNEGKPRSGDDQSKSLIEGETKIITTTTETSSNKTNNASTNYNSNTENHSDKNNINNSKKDVNTNNNSKTSNSNEITTKNTNSNNNISSSSGTAENIKRKNEDLSKINKPKTLGKSINKRIIYIILLLFVIIILILLLIFLVRYINKKQEEKKQRQKAKIQLVEDEKTL